MNKNYLLYAVLIIFSTNLYARFAQPEDLDHVYDYYNVELNVNADGTYERTVEFEIQILKESARNHLSKYTHQYNSDAMNISVLEAETLINGQRIAVLPEMIEDKPTANQKTGFDDTNQLSIGFPSIEVGSKVHLKYTQYCTSPTFDNHFLHDFTIRQIKTGRVLIRSEIPLKMHLNDPHNALKVKTDGDEFWNAAEIVLTKPVIGATVNEIRDSALNEKHQTKVELSSFKSWGQFTKQLYPQYQEKQGQELPHIFTPILKEASQYNDSISQINTVTQRLNEKVHYFGAWGSVKGKIIPQDLNIVAAKQSGDCKDFSTITAKILNSLGFKAHVALVTRGANVLEPENIAIVNSFFNHAMVKAVDKNGQTFWIDPTNITSMANGIYPDIQNKYALVVASTTSDLDKIPSTSISTCKNKVIRRIKKDGTVDFTLNLLGEEALNLTGLGLYASEAIIEDYIYQNVANNISMDDRISSNIPDLTQRVVKPVTISLKYKDPYLMSQTNLGQAYKLYRLTNNIENIVTVDSQYSVHDFFLKNPRTIESVTIFENSTLKNIEKLNLKIDTPYLTLERKGYQNGKDTIVEERTIIHKTWISNEEIKSETFKNLQELIKKDGVAYVITDNTDHFSAINTSVMID